MSGELCVTLRCHQPTTTLVIIKLAACIGASCSCFTGNLVAVQQFLVLLELLDARGELRKTASHLLSGKGTQIRVALGLLHRGPILLFCAQARAISVLTLFFLEFR